MSLEVRTKDGVCILYPKGELWGGQETDDLKAKIQELAQAGNQKLLINLEKTTYMTTLAIAVVVFAYVNYQKRGAQIRLCAVGKRIQQIFVTVKLTLIFGPLQFETEEEALASFTEAAPVG